MGIGKTRNSQVNLDGLMAEIGTARLADEQTAANDKQLEDLRAVQQSLQATTAALNAATDRADNIIKSISTAIEQLQTKKFGAAIHPDTLKALTEVTDNFVIQVGRQLMAHRDKQLEQQNAHEQRLYNILRKSRGLWISHTWLKALTIIFIIYTLLVILFVKFG